MEGEKKLGKGEGRRIEEREDGIGQWEREVGKISGGWKGRGRQRGNEEGREKRKEEKEN